MTMLENAKRLLRMEAPKFRQLGVNKAGIFGSVVRGEAGPESDVDILLELNPDHSLTLLSMVELEEYLAGKLHTKVDLVIGSSIKPLIKERVYNEVVYVYP